MQTLRQKAMYWAIACLVAVLPLLFVAGAHRALSGANVADYLPTLYSDEISYWLQIRAFRDVGFGNGYFSADEGQAPLAWVHYGAWNPSYPMLYGTLARLFEWQPTTPLILHSVFLVLSVMAFIALAQLSLRQIGVLAVLLLSFYPLHLYLFTSMQEVVHHSVALAMAGLLVRALRGQASWGMFALGMVVLGYASLMRLSWALLFLVWLGAFFWQQARGRRWRVLAVVLATGAIGIAVAQLNNWLIPAQSHFTFLILRALQNAPTEGVFLLLQVIADNLRKLREIGTFEIQFFWVVMGMMAIAPFFGLPLRHAGDKQWRVYLVFIYTLSSLLSLLITFYVVSITLRIAAPALLFGLLLMLAFSQYRMVWVWIIVGMIGMPQAFANLRNQAANFMPDTAHLASVQALIAPHITYEAGAGAWCNTVLIDGGMFNSTLTQLPSGIGVSYLWHKPLEVGRHVRSRYLLSSMAHYEERIAPHAFWLDTLQGLARTETFILLENKAADCPPQSQ